MNTNGFGLYKERNHKNELPFSHNKTVSGVRLSHGDMLYLAPQSSTQLWSIPSTSTATIDISQGFYIFFLFHFLCYFNLMSYSFNGRTKTNG